MARIHRLSEAKAYALFKRYRFHKTSGEAYCPHCGSLKVWEYRNRQMYKCGHCKKQFTATSETIFAYSKLSFRKIITAIAIFARNPNAVTAIELSGELDVHYRTAFVLCHKLRDAMRQENGQIKPNGPVAVDGSEIGGHVRPKNTKKSEKDHRKVPYTDKRKSKFAVVIREKTGQRRSIPRVFSHESQSKDFIRSVVPKGTVVHHDAAGWWTD